MFCPKCGALLTPKEMKGKKVMTCKSCGYIDEKAKKIKLKSKVEKKKEIETVEEEVEIHPLVEQECPKCGHDHAYFWEIQTRASDEPATKFFKCQKCKHVWRDYK